MANRNDAPVVEITLADAGKGKAVVALHVSDMRLSWSQYFKKHNQFLFKYVSSPGGNNKHFVLSDNRSPTQRKSWTMNSPVKAFVDGFSGNRKRYTATLRVELKKRNVNQNSSPSKRPHPTPASPVKVTSTTPQRSNGNLQNVPPTGSSTTAPNPTASRKRAAPTTGTSATSAKTCNIGGGEVNLNLRAQRGSCSEDTLPRMMPPLPPISPRSSGIAGSRRVIIPEDDDTASMANTIDSQDSMEDMIADGIQIREVKREVLNHIIKNVSNNDMLRMQHELRKLYADGKWMKVATRIPLNAHFLQMLFNPQN